MISTKAMQLAELSDAELVGESLAGNRDAFRQIVERYQTLISSLAYCATGNLTQSEDLAQETFMKAWSQLAELREPTRLRSWLCSITRFLISKEFRRQGHEPTHQAEPLDSVDECVAPEPLPPDHIISEEERALLWHSLERLPTVYREPLVLFYREHQSVEVVARGLELSEDAVRQRLSRGRKLLQEQLLAFVAGALKQTGPGKAFTLGVMAALPLLAVSAKATTVSAASKGGSAAKAATGGGVLSAFLSGSMILLFSLFGLFGFAGRWMGRKMGLASRQSPCGRKRIVQFWRTLALGFVVFVLPVWLIPHSMVHAHPWLFQAGTGSLAGFYALVATSLIIWIWQQRRDARRPVAQSAEADRVSDRSYNLWVTLGMAGPAILLGTFLFSLFFSNWTLTSRRIPEAEARRIISERAADARFEVCEYRDGSKLLQITLPENPRIDLATPLNASLVSALNDNGIRYPTSVEDIDFHNGGVRGWLMLLSTFIVVAGTVLLIRRPGTRMFYEQAVATPRAERREKKIVGVAVGLVMIAMSLLLVAFTMTHHAAQSISGAEMAKTISELKSARFEVFQYANKSKELWITPPESRHYPAFITPADESTLALLAENNIPYQTYIQGRDFGFRGPSRGVSVSCSVLLAAGAASLLWWGLRKRTPFPAKTESCA